MLIYNKKMCMKKIIDMNKKRTIGSYAKIFWRHFEKFEQFIDNGVFETWKTFLPGHGKNCFWLKYLI